MAESSNGRLLPHEVTFTSRISDESFSAGLPQTVNIQPEVPEARATRSSNSGGGDKGQHKRCSLQGAALGVLKVTGVLSLLYMFICSLDLLSSAFRLLGGKTAGNVFQENELLQNPITGLMIGVLATVILQSSSTSTSIVITMTSSGIIDVRPAIPIVMGANIGTTVTNTLVSLAHAMDPREFRRAFSGATVHDVFNWLTVLVLLPLEYFVGYLFHLTSWLVKSLDVENMHTENHDLLKELTKPLTQRIIMVDEKVIMDIAEGKNNSDAPLLKMICKYAIRETVNEVNLTGKDGNVTQLNQSLVTKVPLESCGHVARMTKHVINADFPSPFSCLTGYVALLVGAGMTVLVQSSSVFTSALTPLVGVGYLKLDRMYPLTLGSNIGTTATGILAALASSASTMHLSLQLALCHLFFNITGIILFYPVPCMRHIPLQAARFLGRTTACYRWFAVFYLIIMFLVFPSCLLALSFAGDVVFISVLVLLSVVVLTVAVISILQKSRFRYSLPVTLRSWNWLPLWLRSLEPMDKFFQWLFSPLKQFCCTCCLKQCHCLSHREGSSDIYDDDDDINDGDDCNTSSGGEDSEDNDYANCCVMEPAGLQRIQHSEIPLQEVHSGVWQKRTFPPKRFAYRPIGLQDFVAALFCAVTTTGVLLMCA
ncbi:hypothetical protein C0Q70_02676 [Pomacea canaliculata]|uniref:Sodium-dependent phosphate transport protein 2B n=1 Tax=Pomacea canaliculata TaxID=400727 RepID=A0A2T7PQL1_POMCA|nr:hypothetical protein C0Q70_02676 [Pomacea canaliculata]